MPEAQAYNSTWQIRNDAWCSLEESSAQLVLAGAQQRPVGELDQTISRLLDVLGPIERFWAFPGMPAFQKVRRLFTAGKYDRFAALVRGINRALATDSYRTGQTWDLGAEDEALDRATHPMEHGRTDRPYFEVLIVEDMTEQQERALREEMRRWRRPDDAFIYEIVVVPSVEDALMAARLNFRLQACVIRRRFARRSRYDTSSLAQFVDSVVADDLMDQSPDERAQVLASTCPSWTGWGRATAPRSSARCAATATGPPACSTRCRSRPVRRRRPLRPLPPHPHPHPRITTPATPGRPAPPPPPRLPDRNHDDVTL